jgi:hypothetical protein
MRSREDDTAALVTAGGGVLFTPFAVFGQQSGKPFRQRPRKTLLKSNRGLHALKKGTIKEHPLEQILFVEDT